MAACSPSTHHNLISTAWAVEACCGVQALFWHMPEVHTGEMCGNQCVPALAYLQSCRVARLRFRLPNLARPKGCSWLLDAPGRWLPDCQCWGSASRTSCTALPAVQTPGCTA